MTKGTLLIAIGLSTLLVAADDEPKQKAIVTKTERFDVAPGGALKLTNSTGQLTIEGWDEPAIEITTIKSSREEYDSREREKALQQLGRVQVTSALHGDEFVIESKYPKYPRLERPFRGLTYFDLEYRIKAARNTTLTIDHDKLKIGAVNSDFPGHDQRKVFDLGNSFVHDSSPARHKLYLRVGPCSENPRTCCPITVPLVTCVGA